MRHTTPTPHDLLSAAEEVRLSTAIEAGVLAEAALQSGAAAVRATAAELSLVRAEGENAWRAFLLANRRLVWMLARRQAKIAGLGVEDLFQEGFVALAETLQRYDHRRGRFTTYALPRIRLRLAEAAANRLGEVPLPRSRALQLHRVRGVAQGLSQVQGAPVAVAELSSVLGRPAAWTEALLRYERPVSLYDESGAVRPGADRVCEPSEDAVDRDLVRRALAGLPLDQRDVVLLRYGFTTGQPEPFDEVGRRLRISESTARRLERRALAELRGVTALQDAA